MSDVVQKVKHILYRQKTKLLHTSRPARWVKSQIWNTPSDGVVTIIYKQDQDINRYFDWHDPDDEIARTKLRVFTERYAREPDVVYEVKGDLVIEPGHGLAIQKGRQYIAESGTLSHIYLKPSIFDYLRHRYFKRTYTEIDSVVHCDGFAGINLCHFIYDTLNPILFMYRRGMITKEDPILVSEKVYQKPYFQYFLGNTFMGELNWLRQREDEWFRVRKFRKAFVSMEIFRDTYALLKAPHRPHRKIFLNRRSKYQRNIRNLPALRAVLDKYGFETVYAEDLSYVQQVELFREVRYFVGIHGAGLTNLLHSSIPDLRVLEIFTESLVHASFYRFLKMLGVGYYDAITGGPFDINHNFDVGVESFEAKIVKLLNSPCE
jgi:hypothetical protein